VDLTGYLAARRRTIERALDGCFPAERRVLRRAVRYSLLAGGKRLRPVLTLAAGELAGARERDLLPFACALELVHTYSLVHDDLPAMDDDDLRRGRPTSHKVFGEGIAILVGDALLTEAFGLMSSARRVPADRIVAAIGELARAAGEAGMVGGQALDLAGQGGRATVARVRDIHERKTGALFTAAVRIGGVVAGAPAPLLARLTRYGRALGLAFQVVDDIDDADPRGTGDGRTDRALDKMTYPALLGMDGARAHAVAARDDALAAIAPLGPEAEPLRALVTAVVASVQTSESAA
jgi:geranylgeranyl diphosphate synthase type II